VTKLRDDCERANRQLDDMDEAEDATMAWAERWPYRSRVTRLRSALCAHREALERLKPILAAMEPRLPHQRLSVGLIRRQGLLDHTPPKSKRGKYPRKSNPLDLAVDDTKRLRDLLPKVTTEQIALIAAERHLRLVNDWCTVDRLDDPKDLEEEWAECTQNELRKFADEVHDRWQHPSGRKKAKFPAP
jgi:hypothetical protein